MRRVAILAAAIMGCVITTAGAVDVTEKTTISGKAFIDMTNVDETSDGAKTNASGTGLDVKRFYLGIDHLFDETWSANLTTDFNYLSNLGQTEVFVKKAYLQGSFGDALWVRAGSADLPWVPFVEGIYGYRYVENVLVDHLKFGTSADWGLHAGGKFADGLVSYAASIVNGAGYKNPTRSKSMDFEGRLSVVPLEGLTFAAGFYSGKLGQDKESLDALHTAQRWDALVAYVNPKFRAGAEYFETKNWRQVLTEATDKASGYSVWGSYNFTDQMSAFARYDNADPSKDLAPDLKSEYWNLGFAYRPRKNIDLAVVYKEDKADNGIVPTSNGPIGGTNDGKYREFGLWAQVAF